MTVRLKKVVMDTMRELVLFETGLTKVRKGGFNDGGYVVIKDFLMRSDTLYSFGIGNDVAFEIDFVMDNPKGFVEAYDPTIPHLPANHPRIFFHRQGIEELPSLCVRDNSILKVDVEGAEWRTFKRMSTNALLAFSQIVMEVHLFHVDIPPGLSPYFRNAYQQTADMMNYDLFTCYQHTLMFINACFRLVHLHVNNSLPPATVAGARFPPLIELTWVRTDLVPDAQPIFPHLPIAGLDAPNKKDRPDYDDVCPPEAIC